MPESVTYLIAGHKLRVVGAQEVALLRSMPGFPLFETEDVSEEEQVWQIEFGQAVSQPREWNVLYKYDEKNASPWCFAQAAGVSYFRMEQSGTSSEPPLLMCYDGGDTVQATHGLTVSELRFALWMAVGMLVSSSRTVLIHSSVIVHDGRAVLFLGESGTGKSTHTRLWLEHVPDSHLLNDDSPALSIENGVPMVYGSPWSGKTHCYHTARFPLAAAVRLSQAPHNSIRRLGVLEAFTALEPSFPPALMREGRFADRFVPMIGDIISAVPVFRLECLPDANAAYTSCGAVFGTVGNPKC